MSETTTELAANRTPAVQRCLDAAEAARAAAALDTGKADHELREIYKEAFLKSLPDLAGYENICEFIACVSYAMVNEIIWPDNATRFLYAAQVALGAFRRAPQPAAQDTSSRLRRSEKTTGA